MRFETMKVQAVLLLAALLISGCASSVTRSPETEKPTVRALQNVTVEISPNAKKSIAGDVAFDIDTLAATLDEALMEQQLLAADGDFDLEVVITDVRVRGTASAIMFGFLAGDDHLTGEAIVLNRDGEAVYTYIAEASYALGGFAGGEDTTRLDWLYGKFSELVADELAIKKSEGE